MTAKKAAIGLLAGALVVGGGVLAASALSTRAVAVPASPESVAKTEGYNFGVDGLVIAGTASDGQKTLVFTDVPTYDNIEALATDADVIVVGRVTGKGGSRNLARDPNDPTKEASDRKVMSQEYAFSVEKYLKGNGDAKIDIVYPESTAMGTEAAIPEPETKLEVSQRYVLFLKKGEGYFGVGQPWQFQLINGRASAKAYNPEHAKPLDGLTEEALLQKVQGAMH